MKWDVVEWWRWWMDMGVWWRSVGVGLMLPLAQCHKPRPLSVDMLSVIFGALSDDLPSHDGFLFLLEPLYFLLDPDQLLLLCNGFIFFSFLIPILHLDLIKLSVALHDLYW
jgi:hypothetical protein